MKIALSSITFGNKNNIYAPNSQAQESFLRYDSGEIKKSFIYDKWGRIISCCEYDKKGNLISQQNKSYSNNGCVETYKSQTQEYIRKCYVITKGNFKHFIEEFISRTSPDKNYVLEFVRDVSDKLVKIISNGKVLNLK
jgi:hypothetical protein